MKKGYYVYVENCGSSGVMKKIEMQLETFSKELDIQAIKLETVKRTLLQRIWALLPWNSFQREYDKAISQLNDPDFVYIRRIYVDHEYVSFLKKIKSRYPKCKIVIELPVYPYKKEMLSTFYTCIAYCKEIFYRREYSKYIDRFVTYSNDDVIMGIPTIQTMNGINVAEIIPIEVENRYDRDNIHLLAVALFARHHGYERMIKGLKDYYEKKPSRKVYFHLVGNGSEEHLYKKLVNKYRLEEYVKFHGPLYEDKLNSIYNRMDAGVAALGVYKDGLAKLSTIKAREYLAKGLPVILGAEDNLFNGKGADYGILFPNDSSNIDIHRIIAYLDDLYRNCNRSEVVDDIRKFAIENVDNSITLHLIVQYIEG